MEQKYRTVSLMKEGGTRKALKSALQAAVTFAKEEMMDPDVRVSWVEYWDGKRWVSNL